MVSLTAATCTCLCVSTQITTCPDLGCSLVCTVFLPVGSVGCTLSPAGRTGLSRGRFGESAPGSYQILVHAPDALRHETASKTQITLARHLSGSRPRRLDTPEDALRHTLRSLAKRWQYLDAEAKELTRMIADLVQRTAPQLLDSFGIGVDTAAEILVVTGDNPERIKSEAALANLAGIAPVPTGSGMTSGRHRINHGGHRQLNAAIYRTVIVRMRFHQPTIDYVARRTTEGKTKREIIRCLKRYVIREVYHLLRPAPQAASTAS